MTPITHEQDFLIDALWKVVKNREGVRKWRAANLEKARETSRKWHAANLEKAREASRKWHAANLEKAREGVRKWHAANLEKGREYNRKWRAANLEKARETSRKWHAANPEKARETSRKWHAANLEKHREYKRKLFYGAGAHEHLEAQVKAQGNCCAICAKPFTKTPHLDHNHETNQWRGALCLHCNSGIGYFKDDPVLLSKAIAYLEEWRENGNAKVSAAVAGVE